MLYIFMICQSKSAIGTILNLLVKSARWSKIYLIHVAVSMRRFVRMTCITCLFHLCICGSVPACQIGPFRIDQHMQLSMHTDSFRVGGKTAKGL